MKAKRPLWAAAILAGGLSLATALTAFANHPIITGTGPTCQNGQQVVTWTVTNSEFTVAAGGSGRTMTIVSPFGVSQGSITAIKLGDVLQPQPSAGSTETGTTTLVGNLTGSVTLTVTGHFFNPDGSDSGLVDTEQATIDLPGSCGTTTQTIAGHIFDCTGGTATTTEVPGGTLGATGPQTVPTQSNPLNPTSVAAGTYTMTATSPPGFQLVACNGTTGSSTQSVTVPSGGTGVGIFYVSKIPTAACPTGEKLNFRWHYSANNSSGSWSGTQGVVCPGSDSQGPQAMEGDMKLSPGTTLLVGYDFTAPGNNSTFSVNVNNPQVVFTLHCASGATPSQATLTVTMPNATYTVTNSNWIPSGDQHSSLVYQGSTTVPDVCSGGQVRFNAGGTFSATVN